MDNEDTANESRTALTAELADEAEEISTKSSNTGHSRKRTKTGCLTCRRRRIKCGEEQPTCGNCVKSKRQCEGYSQRVIFKHPLSTYRGHISSVPARRTFTVAPDRKVQSGAEKNLFRHVSHLGRTSSTASTSRRKSSFQQLPIDAPQFPARHDKSDPVIGRASNEVSPRDIPNKDMIVCNVPTSEHLVAPASSAYGTGGSVNLLFEQGTPNDQPRANVPTHYEFHNPQQRGYQSSWSQNHDSRTSDCPEGADYASVPSSQGLVYRFDVREAASALLTNFYQGSENWSVCVAQHSQTPSNDVTDLQSPMVLGPLDHKFHTYPVSRAACSSCEDEIRERKQQSNDGYLHNQQMPTLRDWTVNSHESSGAKAGHEVKAEPVENEPLAADEVPGGFQQAKHILQDNVNSYKSDDNMETEYDYDPGVDINIAQCDHLSNNDLGIVVALQATRDRQDQSLRTYHSFLDGPDILAMYQPSSRNSPLSDSTTARIFVHFINVTGPSISLYERHPANPSLMFQGHPVPKSQQHIWAYTMPILALHNQAILHAMLAIGSLHIALLQDTPITASLKHYHIAIRQVAKSVSLPMRRGQPATLAATMLLGWYELMSADHQKWSSHLLGARHLLADIDFAGMTRYIKKRGLQEQKFRSSSLYHHEIALEMATSKLEDHEKSRGNLQQVDIDENLLSMIMGKELTYDQHGQILEEASSIGGENKDHTERDLEIYENQRDLFWWYCKQDAFQSIISGNSLFMNYNLWSQCPPRAAIGRREATYGTYDHVILLLGRLAEFAAKDLKRKRKAISINGGHWRPPPGNAAQPTSAGQNVAMQSVSPQMPSFAGMMPGTEGKTKLPRGFCPAEEKSPATDDDERDLVEWTRKAEYEWHEIRTAFNMLEENYGPDFQPLGPEHSPRVQTPFGPTLQYRTYSIAGIWIVHFMGLILCHRYHPSMPPAATIAAGIAARETAFFANEIGRISAAIAPNASSLGQVPTGVGAGLIESTFGLFIAGVQYQDAVQRCWLVKRCLDIKRLTGWKTAEAVAMGCESSWVRAAELGRGPPYQRVMEKKADQKVWYTARRRIDQALSGKNDSNRLLVKRTDRVHYALGLLGVEEDFEHLDFEHDAKRMADQLAPH